MKILTVFLFQSFLESLSCSIVNDERINRLFVIKQKKSNACCSIKEDENYFRNFSFDQRNINNIILDNNPSTSNTNLNSQSYGIMKGLSLFSVFKVANEKPIDHKKEKNCCDFFKFFNKHVRMGSASNIFTNSHNSITLIRRELSLFDKLSSRLKERFNRFKIFHLKNKSKARIFDSKAIQENLKIKHISNLEGLSDENNNIEHQRNHEKELEIIGENLKAQGNSKTAMNLNSHDKPAFESRVSLEKKVIEHSLQEGLDYDNTNPKSGVNSRFNKKHTLSARVNETKSFDELVKFENPVYNPAINLGIGNNTKSHIKYRKFENICVHCFLECAKHFYLNKKSSRILIKTLSSTFRIITANFNNELYYMVINTSKGAFIPAFTGSTEMLFFFKVKRVYESDWKRYFLSVCNRFPVTKSYIEGDIMEILFLSQEDYEMELFSSNTLKF